MENKIHLIFVILLFINGHDAYTLKRTIARLNYVESRLNDEIKIIREDLSALFNKLESIDSKLGMASGKTDTVGGTTDDTIVDHVTPVLLDKIQRLLKAFEDEKAQYNIFRREVSNEVKVQAQANIDKMKELLRQEVKSMENDMALNIEVVKEILRENNEHLSQNLTDLGNRFQDILDEVYQKRQNNINTQAVTVHVTPLSNKIETTKSTVEAAIKKYTSCLDLYNDGIRENGLFQIHIPVDRKDSIPVYCDMTTDGGGWTIFQRRQDGSVDFNRDWNEYKNGFGNLEGEFWLGNEYLHALTDNGKNHQLRIDLEDFDDKRAYVKYEIFKVGSESTKYKLEVSGYTGNAGDLLAKNGVSVGVKGITHRLEHSGMPFSTKDNNNDFIPGTDCALPDKGGWWYHHCFSVNLNVKYGESGDLYWYKWNNNNRRLKITEMKLR